MKLDRVKTLVCMARKEMSGTDLAEMSGVSRQTISSVLHGKDCFPETVGKIATALGVDPAAIVERS